MGIVGTIDLVLKIFVFAWFAYGAFSHFSKSDDGPVGDIIVKSASTIGLFISLWLLFAQQEQGFVLPGVTLTLISGAIFYNAIQASKSAKLHVSFSDTTGDSLVSSGIYRFVRHPFYLSYIVYWVSWCLSLEFHTISIGILVVLVALYLKSIRHEEKELERNFGDEYRHYRKRTSLLIPYLI